jgi:AmmeMemoRadiSam system protein B/AmmeMemoRadiSam system protein A
MTLRVMICVPVVLFLSLTALAQGTRRAVWAGQFYEADPQRLSLQIDGMLAGAGPGSPAGTVPAALIVPHAGYVYSGQVAARAYRLVQGRDIQTVVVVGVAHRHGFPGASIYLRGGYETPLGMVEIDEPLAEELSRVSGFGFVPPAHREEHSIDVQVPFIQKALPGAKLVPVLTGLPNRDNMTRLAQAMAKVLPGKRALVIVSSDMSHFLTKKEASQRDSETISWLVDQDVDRLIPAVIGHDNRMCGGTGAVTALLYAAQLGRPRVELIDYADSSAAGGRRNQVVGYASLAVYADPHSESFELSNPEQQELVGIARRALELMVRRNQIFDPQLRHSRLGTPAGAFVTLKKQGRLRGCIGFIEPPGPLYRTVALAAGAAATRDQRFRPVTPAELPSIEIEISVLSPPRRIQDPGLVEVGKHGLIVSQGGRKGLLLPQVPVENQWDRRMFLQQACLKAGLPKDAWKRGAELFVFEALVFH